MISIKFLGAAGTVTGSKHLLQTPEGNYLIDCGLFQGIKLLREKNRESLQTDIKSISAVLLTHAHLDHCGYIPLLAKNGFTGKIYMSAPTRDLTELILRDSAKIQEEDAEFANQEGYSKHTPALPLYTIEDVENVLPLFHVINDEEWLQLSTNIKFRYRKNGHILGSCFIEMDCFGKRIVFSGDIGNSSSLYLNEPLHPESADFLIMESTYGDRLHETKPASDLLAQIIKETLNKRGNLLIPSFAVGRAQELMLLISDLKKSGKISSELPVYLDSPMGADATNILCHYPQWHKLEETQYKSMCEDINIIRDFKISIKLVKDKMPKIVIAASGMITGGRVLHYMKKYAAKRKNTVLLVGYQAEGTRGRALQNGVGEVKIHGEYFPVRCNVNEIRSLSAHADQRELLDWVKAIPLKPGKIFLVHGEPAAQDTLRVKLKDELNITATIPSQNDEFILFNL